MNEGTNEYHVQIHATREEVSRLTYLVGWSTKLIISKWFDNDILKYIHICVRVCVYEQECVHITK